VRHSAVWLFGLVPLVVAAGCASSGAVNAALESDLGALRRSIRDEQRTGVLDQSRAKKIARAVAEREVYAGSGPGAVARIRSLRACSSPVLPALEARADRQDEAAAEAALVLLAAHELSPETLAGRYEDADSGAWRAVAARASVAPERFARRRRYYVDPDQRVRRAALEAAVEAPASLDEAALLGAARLDPDAMCRSLATRAVGAAGGEHAVRALVDLWDRADEADRLNVVEAFGERRAFEAGGRSELLRIADSEHGVPAVAARGELARLDTTSAAAMTNLLARDITDGSADEQELAIEMAPLSGPVVPALERATRDAEPIVRVAALERLLDVPEQRATALAALRREAKTDATGAARAALARAHDASVRPALVKELAAPGWQARKDAGISLISLGDYTHAATLLADDDANVRVAIACSMLQSS
jgi:hypothetical protein